MNNQRSWKAYRLDSSSFTGLFSLIKEHLVPYVDENNFRFWITNYWNPGENPNTAFRIFVNATEQIGVETYLDGLVNNSVLIEKHSATDWDPYTDAERRVQGARVRLEEAGAQLEAGGYPPVQVDYLQYMNAESERIEELAELFGAVGEATKAFYKALPRKPVDPLILSVTMHILFNSLTLDGPSFPSEETRVRFFPPI